MFDFFSPNPCGVKISDSVLEIMEISEDRVVETYGRKLFDSGIVEQGRITDKERLAEIIRNLIKEIGVSAERARVSLSSSQSFPELFEFEEDLKGRELRQAVLDKAQEMEGPDPGECYWNFKRIGGSESGTKVLYEAVEKEVLDDYSEVMELAGLKLVRVEPEQLALGRALLTSDGEHKSRAILNLEPRTATLSVFGSENEFNFTSRLDFEGQRLDRALADKKEISLKEARQLKRKFGLDQTKRENEVAPVIREQLESVLEQLRDEISYYENNFGKIEQIILSGREALIPGLNDYLATELSKEVRMGNPLVNLVQGGYLAEEDAIHPVVFAPTIGLSLSEIEGYQRALDLVPSVSVSVEEVEQETESMEQEEKEPEQKQKEGVLEKVSMSQLLKGAGIVLVVAVLGGAGYLFTSNLEIEQPQSKTEGQVTQTQEETSTTTEQQQKQQQEQQEKQPEPEPKIQRVVIIQPTPTGWLRVRGGPGTSYEELDKIEPDQKFPRLDEKNGWYQIELPYGKGWIYGDYATTGTTTVSESQ